MVRICPHRPRKPLALGFVAMKTLKSHFGSDGTSSWRNQCEGRFAFVGCSSTRCFACAFVPAVFEFCRLCSLFICVASYQCRMSDLIQGTNISDLGLFLSHLTFIWIQPEGSPVCMPQDAYCTVDYFERRIRGLLERSPMHKKYSVEGLAVFVSANLGQCAVLHMAAQLFPSMEVDGHST